MKHRDGSPQDDSTWKFLSNSKSTAVYVKLGIKLFHEILLPVSAAEKVQQSQLVKTLFSAGQQSRDSKR